MSEFDTKYKELLQEYEAKLSIPNWFVSNIKTSLDRNITIEDWNKLYVYLSRLASDDEVLLKLLKLFENTFLKQEDKLELQDIILGIKESVEILISNGASNIRLLEDPISTNIEFIFNNYYDYTFSSKNIESISATITENVGQGTLFGLNFSATQQINFELINNSRFPIVIWKNGLQKEMEIPESFENVTVTSVFVCDGIKINWYIQEASL